MTSPPPTATTLYKPMANKLCRWNCGRKTDRRCGICIYCCDERDKRNKRIDAGLEAYVPPDKRPGHRFYKGPTGKRPMTDKQRAALTKARATKSADPLKQMPSAGGFQPLDAKVYRLKSPVPAELIGPVVQVAIEPVK
jgi:hypothetical protein